MDEKTVKKINWVVGLNRLFIAGWVLWALFLFVWLPLKQIHGAQDFASSMYATEVSDGYPKTDEGKAGLEARSKERWAQASWYYVYKTQVLPDIWTFIGAALLIPPFVYGLIRGFMAILVWLGRGFIAP